MGADVVQAALAVLAFLVFPFAVISTAAGLLVLCDRLIHHRHGH